MSVIYKSKSELRAESAQAVEAFLRAGGAIEVIPARRRKVRHECKAKGARSFSNNGSLGYRTSGVFK
jgi:hypothetical protein